jgi:hypothetical protein
MKNTLLHLTAIASLAVTGAGAQTTPSAFDFRAVVRPGTIIGGHVFTLESTIGNAVLNDSGEPAFVAGEPWPQVPAVFTSRRIVARQGDVIDGKYILELPPNAILAINNAGQVAYEAWYSDNKALFDAGEESGLGVFVENHLASDAEFDAHKNATPFTLTDDGRIVFQSSGASRAPSSAKSGVLDRIHIKPPTGFPLNIPPNLTTANRQQPNPGQHPGDRTAPPLFPTNHRGQVLIPVNFKNGGCLLLLGAPAAR